MERRKQNQHFGEKFDRAGFYIATNIELLVFIFARISARQFLQRVRYAAKLLHLRSRLLAAWSGEVEVDRAIPKAGGWSLKEVYRARGLDDGAYIAADVPV